MAVGTAPAVSIWPSPEPTGSEVRGIPEHPGSAPIPRPSLGAHWGQELALTHAVESQLHSCDRGLTQRQASEENAEVFKELFCSGPGVLPLERRLIAITCSSSPCAVLCAGWRAASCKTATKRPTQSSSQWSLGISNLCPESLSGLKVTLQLSICTNTMKERRGSVSQFIFQIGDKNWLVMAENSTKDYYCWLIPLWQKVR